MDKMLLLKLVLQAQDLLNQFDDDVELNSLQVVVDLASSERSAPLRAKYKLSLGMRGSPLFRGRLIPTVRAIQN